MGSQRLGVLAKMDLVEVRPVQSEETMPQYTEQKANTKPGPQSDFTDQLFTRWEVCPVDYKAGAPKEGQDANELWDTDKMQLGLQGLILRDNGYTCNL